MKVDIRDLTEEGIQVSGSVSAADYDLPLSEYQDWNTIEYDLMVMKIETECFVDGVISASFKVACSRCLEPLSFSIKVEPFQYSFALEGQESIDLTPQMREDMLLHLPLAHRCELDGNFRCPVTGQVFAPAKNEFAELNRQSVWGVLDDLKKKGK